jgi:hypothetical protein
MAEKRTIELEIQDNSKSLKAQYREAVAELQKVSAAYGETSQEAIKAAQAAAELKDQIEFSKEVVNAFNPDEKFKALEGAISGVMNGFQAFEGAMGLMGVESEELQKTMVKLQSVMALTQGINGLMAAADSFKILGLKAVTAFSGMTKASKIFVASGIGLLITVLAIAANEMGFFTDKTKEQELAQKQLEKQTKALEKTIESYNNATNQLTQSIDNATRSELALARQRGASQSELTKITKEGAKSRLEALQSENEGLKQQYMLYSKSGTFAQFEKAEKAWLESNQKVRDAQITIQELDADIAEQARENSKSFAESKASTVKEVVNLYDQIIDEQIKLLEDESQRNQTQLIVEAERRKKEIQNTVADKKQKAKLIKLIEENLIAELDKLDNEWYEKSLEAQKQADAAKIQAKLDFDNEIEKISEENTLRLLTDQEKEIRAVNDKYFTLQELAKNDAEAAKEIEIAKLNELNDINLKYQEIDFKNKEAATEKEKARIKQLNDYRLKSVQDTLQMVANLAELFAGKSEKQQKKAFQVQKAVNISNAVIDTYKAANVALASSPPPFNYIAMAAAITAGLVNVKKIASQQFQTSGTQPSGGSNAPTAAPMTANFNTIGSSGINQLAQLQQTPTQAYVVSAEVTSAQALDRNRVQNATL